MEYMSFVVTSNIRKDEQHAFGERSKTPFGMSLKTEDAG